MFHSHALSPKRFGAETGFSMLEVLVAITILSIGMMSAAFLMAHVYKLSTVSRSMALAAKLTSEKLEDLSRYPNNVNSGYIDPHIQVPAGSNTCGDSLGMSCIGSLTSDYGPVTVGGTSVSYYDSVLLATQTSVQNGVQIGLMTETYRAACTTPGGAAGNYITVPFSPNGVPPPWPATCSTTAPAALTFDRRWVIEQDQPVVGLRRVTVLVTLDDLSAGMYVGPAGSGQQPPPSITSQMSMVRP